MIRCLAAVASAIVIGVAGTGPAAAIDEQPPSGGADVRSAPLISDGTIDDTALVGEAVWYAIAVGDESQRLTVGVSITDERFDSRIDAGLELYGPDLRLVAATDSPQLDQIVSFAGSDGAATWFVSVRLSDDAALRNAEVPISVGVDGTRPSDDAPCRIGSCALADRSARLVESVESLESDLRRQRSGTPEPSTDLASTESDRLELLAVRRGLIDDLASATSDPWAPPGPLLAAAGFGGAVAGALAVTTFSRRRRRHVAAVSEPT